MDDLNQSYEAIGFKGGSAKSKITLMESSKNINELHMVKDKIMMLISLKPFHMLRD